MLKKYKYILKNLDCAGCALEVQKAVASHKEYKNVVVNFSTLTLSFEAEEDDSQYEKIIKIVTSVEPDVEVLNKEDIETNQTTVMPSIIRLLLGIIIALIGNLLSNYQTVSTILIIIAYILLLSRTAKAAYKTLIKSKTINENFLVTISCIGAYLVGEHMEGLMVIILYEIGKILEEKAINNTRKSIRGLMNIKPEYANKKIKNKYEVVRPEELKIGDIIVVKQGEKVPIDGIVISGEAYLDTSALTGESEERKVEEGSNILSGSINNHGLVEIKVTCEYENSTVNKILELVENATDNKTKTETFVSKAARIYTPIVLILAILVAIFLPVFGNVSYSTSIYRALIFLVISCPCAIAISVPLSYFSGIGAASKRGILIKGSTYLDNLKDVKTIIFDKTGTITTGTFEVKEIKSYDDKYSKDKILDLLAKGESFSNHPIAKSILNLVNTELDLTKVSSYKEVAGKGIEYKLGKKQIKIGTKEYAGFKGKESKASTVIYLSCDDKVIGSAVIDDGIKDKAKETIAALNNMGIRTAMFTGDNKEVALAIAKKLNISEVEYELLPTDKYKKLEELMQDEQKRKIAFVGDGINDAPVIARSDIGFSMGNLGSSSAIEASDIVIMTDELDRIVKAIEISAITRRIIKQNLIFAISTKIIILLLSIFGIAGMWQAIFADVGVTLITILNTTRILKKED